MLRFFGIVLLLAAALTASGCGGSNLSPTSSQPQPPPSPSSGAISVSSISPSSAAAGSPDTTLSITGNGFPSGHSISQVIWTAGAQASLSVTPVDATHITAVVPAALLTSPVTASIVVQKYDLIEGVVTGQSNSVSFTVTSAASQSGTVSISPASETLRTGGQRQFSGWDSTVGQYDVSWSLEEGAVAGTITADGLYAAPSTPGTFHLIATSSHNSKLTATAVLKVVSVGFVPTSDMSVPRSGHTATLLPGGAVLVAGGTTDSAHSAELFSPMSGTFGVTNGSMVYTRSGHCTTLLPDGRVLIIGGGDSSSNLFKTAELFSPATQNFTQTGNLNQARIHATATLLPTGRVLVAGGQDRAGTFLSSAELYDPTTGIFTPTENMHSSRAWHTATLLSDGKVLLVGSSNETNSAELFDPVSGHFTATGSLIQARAHHTATLLPNGNVLILGGTHVSAPVGGGAAAAPVSLDAAEVYDATQGVFRTAGRLLIARDSHSATLLADGTVLVAGGYSHGFDGDADPEWFTMFATELFDPARSVSTPAASLETDRAEHVATMLANGQVLITGGVAGFQELCCRPKPQVVTLASAEVYK